MRIVCFGDSNTYGFDPREPLGGRYGPQHRWTDLLARETCWQVKNRGQNGRSIPVGNPAVEPVLRMLRANAPVEVLVVMLGTNDLLQGVSAPEAGRRMQAFLEQVKPACGGILLVAPPLQAGAWVTEEGLLRENARMAETFAALARDLRIAFADAREWNVDMVFDGVHLSEEGNKTFAGKLRAVLEQCGHLL